MAYFTFRFRDAAGGTVHKSDFTLLEFVPIVRHTLRSLTQEPELAAGAAGYKAVIRPCYDEILRQPADTLPSVTPALLRPVEDGSVLQISEEDLKVYAPISYLDEIEAFYNPGPSALCASCPDRLRCLGSGVATSADVSGWIELDPASLRSNVRVSYFALRIESADGRVLHTSNISLTRLRFYANYVLTVLKTAGHTNLAGVQRADIIARFEGQPQIEPILDPRRRPAATFRDHAPVFAPQPAPPGNLVDWEGIEEPHPAATHTDPQTDMAELEIKVFPTETTPLPHRSPPPAKPYPGSRIDPEHLPIFLHRSVVRDLETQRLELRSDVGGILVGEAILDPADGKPYVEVVAALAATGANGEQMRVNLDSHFLRQIQERIDREYPGRRTIGWYQFHLLRVAVRTANGVVTAGVLSEPLEMLDDELFLHRNFFPERWHLGLVIDASKGALRFYHLKDGEISPSAGCRLVD